MKDAFSATYAPLCALIAENMSANFSVNRKANYPIASLQTMQPEPTTRIRLWNVAIVEGVAKHHATAMAFETIGVDPAALVAVTRQETLVPLSAARSSRVEAVAPAMFAPLRSH